MRNNMLLLIVLFIISSACQKQMPNPITPCQNPPCDTTDHTKLPKEVIWQVPSQPDSSTCLSNYPLIYKNEVLFTKFLCEKGMPVFFRDKSSGKLLHLSNEVSETFESATSVGMYLYQNYYAVCSQYLMAIYDLDQQKLLKLWNVRDLGGEGEPRVNGIGPWVFQGWTSNHNGKAYYSSSLVRRNMITSQYDTVCSIKSDLCYTPTIEAPTFWINPQNDTIVIFQNSQYRFGGNLCKLPVGYRTDLYAYNMTKHKMEWTVQDFAITKQSSVQLAQVFNNKLFFQGSNEAFVFDCFTGKLIWSQYFPGESFFNTNAVLAEGKIILKSETDRMIALDAQSGNIIWDNPNAGHSNSNMIYYKGKVYYETGQDGLGVIRALKVADGLVTWTWFPNNYPKFSNVSYGLCGIAIDEETGLLYTHDRRFMQCIKIPE